MMNSRYVVGFFCLVLAALHLAGAVFEIENGRHLYALVYIVSGGAWIWGSTPWLEKR